MSDAELKAAVNAIVSDNDPYKDPKILQLDQWRNALLEPFYKSMLQPEREKFHPFYAEALTDEECWAESDTPHGIKFNRRVAARKMVASENKGTENHLTLLKRYNFACVYCLEEDIDRLLEELRQEYHHELRGPRTSIVARLLRAVGKKGHIYDMTEFWSYYAIGEIGELNLEGENFYAYGLKKVLSKSEVHVEAVEYFWDKTKSANSLNDREKDEIFMNAAISAIGRRKEVFEFCFSQLSPDKYPEFLRRDLEMNRHHESFQKLQFIHRFDLCRKIFDCLKPDDIAENRYSFWLSFMRLIQCPDHYIDAAVELVMHMWTKVGFDRHRAYALKDELGNDSSRQGDLLFPLVKRNYMQAVWTILDEVRGEVGRKLFNEFLKSPRAHSIVDTLKVDGGSLTRFLAYSIRENEQVISRVERRF